jgi:Asp/Glu/hydantoin racemase
MTQAAGPKRRILVINPNSSLAVTQAIDAAVQPLRIAGGPEVAVDYLREGPAGIATQRDADSVVMPLVERVRQDQADAFVLACFSDPGLHAVREAAAPRPVMGIAEWGLLRALTLGESFGIIALSSASMRRQQRYVRQMGLHDRYAGSWPIDAFAADTADDSIRDRLVAAGRKLVARRGADVLILGCAGMARHRRALQETIGRPVVEPTQQAVAAALGALLLATS